MQLTSLQWQILESLASKADNETGANDVVINGVAVDAVDDAIEDLHRRQLINAWRTEGLGPESKWSVESLTPLGRGALKHRIV